MKNRNFHSATSFRYAPGITPASSVPDGIVKHIDLIIERLGRDRANGYLRLPGHLYDEKTRFKREVVKIVLQVLRDIEVERQRRAREVTAFCSTAAWRELRYRVLTKRGARCECCGATPADGKIMHVDHVKPRSEYPELALDEANLQVLCEDCNVGKSNKDETDWRAAVIAKAAHT